MPSNPKNTIGYLCNNPCNLLRSFPPWHGEITNSGQAQNSFQYAQLASGRFAVFETVQLGYRATRKNLYAYRGVGDTYPIDYIKRWAPAPKVRVGVIGTVANGEDQNDPLSYCETVCAVARINPDVPLDLDKDVGKFMMGMTHVELGGFPYDYSVIEESLKLT